MTSIEIPYSIAAALPTLSAIDITNDIQHALDESELESGIALLFPRSSRAIVRVGEREAGIFEDFENLLGRLVPHDWNEREDLLLLLLGPRGDQIPFSGRRLQLGEWQRVLLLSFDGGAFEPGWRIILIGAEDASGSVG
jgi:thiamine phosphate synthase YjbQ (UPF0047 family)